MNDRRYGLGSLALGVIVALAACGGGSAGPMGPMDPGSGGMPAGTPAFMSLNPGGGAMGVPVGTSLEFRWGVTMGAGMEQYIELHKGDLSDPVVPMGCAWSGDQTTLVCTPSSPLQPRTQYTIHVGGGMVDANGQVVDMDAFGPGHGGQWITGGGPGAGGHHGGAHHASQPWGGLGPGWRHPNGAYGMAFTFTTA